jgi:predicted component of type VI protein secretion system
MRHFALLMFCILTGLTGVIGQNTQAGDQEARTATDKLVAKYKLNPDQAKAMYTVEVRKFRNRSEIAALKTSNPSLYRRKEQNVQSGTLTSIRHILNTKDQVNLFEKTKRDLRAAKVEKRKELTVKGASKDAIEDAMLDMFAE